MRIGQIGLLGLLAVLFLLPILLLAVTSISLTWTYPQLLPESFSFRAFDLLTGKNAALLLSLFVSAGYSLCVAALAYLLCLLPARVFAYENFRGKSLLEGALLSPAILPPMTFSMGLHGLFIRLGLSDTFLGIVLILTFYTYPYMLRSLTSGYKSIGENTSPCARNLGAGYWRTLFRIEIPALFPAASAGSFIVFLAAFSDYFLVFLIGGGIVPSYTGFLVPFLASSDHAHSSLLVLIFFSMPLLFFGALEFLGRRKT